MYRMSEDALGLADLDDAPGVHDGDGRHEAADDGEVVADIHRCHAVGRAELAHGVEHVALGRDVETGGRLVEDDEARTAREGHRQGDALLLAPRQLVGVAAKVAVARREADLLQDLLHACLYVGDRSGVGLKALFQLGADSKGRVERRGGILRDVGDLEASKGAHLLG